MQQKVTATGESRRRSTPELPKLSGKTEWPADRVERRPVSSLLASAFNARTHSDEQVRQIAAAIVEWGWTNPVLIDESGTILAGHGRVLAAQLLGIEEVPVIVARGWTPEQCRAYILADNRLAEMSGWDQAKLAVELTEVGKVFSLDLVGFGAADVASLVPAIGGGGDGIETPPVSKYEEQYGVIVICDDEAHQQKVYAELKDRGYVAKVVAT